MPTVGTTEALKEPDGGIILDTMFEEEARLEQESEEKEKEIIFKVQERMVKENLESRYEGLQLLLSKSNIYSKFLLSRMEQQQANAQRRKEKKQKKAEKIEDEKLAQVDEDGKVDDSVKEHKVIKREREELLGEAAGGEDNSNKKMKAEDEIQNYSEDTNDAMKSRLTDSLRKNIHSDPQRVINGQQVPLKQPRFFTGGIMRSYQVEGLEWLRMLWENGINAILADEMGLGKTVQCIALIALMVECKVKGPFFVCGPLSTLPNWISEFKRFTPKIPVMLYHGNMEERRIMRAKILTPQGNMNLFPVIITSYEIAMKDRKHLQYIVWRYLILDEGHRIKNMKCRLIRELKQYRTDNKLLLTGTPLQNNLSELWSLLNFLIPEVFDDLKSFESWFDVARISQCTEELVKKEQNEQILKKLHQILTPFLLRRLKIDVAIGLPPKQEVLVYAPLCSLQKDYYTSILDGTISDMLTYKKNQDRSPVCLSSTGRPQRNTQQLNSSRRSSSRRVLSVKEEAEERRIKLLTDDLENSQINVKLANIFMMLRKCCNHAYLIKYPLNGHGQFKVDEALVRSSGKLLLLDRMLPELKRRGHKILIFSQMTKMLDILHDFFYLRGFRYSRLDGSMTYTEREENMAIFNSDPEVFIFMLSTRAGGLGINLTAADTVIIYDSDCNPQVDLQAQDRCHRIGQTRRVIVYRLVTAGTVDQRIVELAITKRRLEKLIIHKNKFKGGESAMEQACSGLDAQELRELLHSTDYSRVVGESSHSVISDENLKLLLDRDTLARGKLEETKDKEGVFKIMANNQNSL
uniref:lymphoid-specific helicase isoform X2 n=1 Tax=Myxine glutinosa TaxID=7769 RepID=UPI00358F8B5C